MRKKIKFSYKAAIFDMDGVITDTMRYHFDAWIKTFALVGIRVNCYDVYLREGQDGLTSVKEIYKRYGRPLNLKEAKLLLAKKEKLFKRIVKVRFVRGALPFLRRLKKRGLLLGLVTGTSRHEMCRMLPEKLRNLFDVLVTGNDVKKGKPHPEPFLKALKLLGARASEAAVIENAPFGIQAAKKAGLFCIALETSLPRKYLRRADIILKSYEELTRMLG